MLKGAVFQLIAQQPDEGKIHVIHKAHVLVYLQFSSNFLFVSFLLVPRCKGGGCGRRTWVLGHGPPQFHVRLLAFSLFRFRLLRCETQNRLLMCLDHRLSSFHVDDLRSM